MERDPHQHRRYSWPRRLSVVRLSVFLAWLMALRAGRCSRRPNAADQVRAGESSGLGLKPIVVSTRSISQSSAPTKCRMRRFDLFGRLVLTKASWISHACSASAKAGWAAWTRRADRRHGSAVRRDRQPYVPHQMSMLTGRSPCWRQRLRRPISGPHADGRIESGTIVANWPGPCVARRQRSMKAGVITKILAFRGLDVRPVTERALAISWRWRGFPKPPSRTPSLLPK